MLNRQAIFRKGDCFTVDRYPTLHWIWPLRRAVQIRQLGIHVFNRPEVDRHVTRNIANVFINTQFTRDGDHG